MSEIVIQKKNADYNFLGDFFFKCIFCPTNNFIYILCTRIENSMKQQNQNNYIFYPINYLSVVM